MEVKQFWEVPVKIEDTSDADSVSTVQARTSRTKNKQSRNKIPSSIEENTLQEIDKQRYNIRTILQYSNATPIRTHHVGSGYTCCFCKLSFLKAADLKTHTIQEHDDITKSKFMHRSYLGSFAVKLDITSLNCNICNIDTDTLELLMDHLNSAHEKGLHADIKNQIVCFKLDEEEMKCHICSQEYRNFKLLREHMNKHIINFTCDECGAGFINRSRLLSHSDMHKVGTYKCDTCEKVFNSSARLKSHMRQTHTAISLYKCHQCDERFKSKRCKNKHMTKAHGVVYADLKCDDCNRTFKSTDSLRIHRKKDHLMERRFKCECGRAFFNAVMLKEHQATHTGLRPFQCDMCSKSYSRKYVLKEHIRSHTGNLRFKCTYCDMAFLQKFSLRDHLRNRHNAELP